MSPSQLFVVALSLLAIFCLQVQSAKSDRQNQGSSRRKATPPPLLEEKPRRKGPRQTHCHFGNQSYELEDRWMPNLGPPFGVLYCVRCECVPTPRKKRIVARTRCENIKNVCPKPTCDNPVLLPERCCKTCSGEDNAAIEEDLARRQLEGDDDERNTKEYSVLLTGRGLSPTQPVSGAGRAYLTAFKRHLHYTIYFSGLERPRWIRFKNEDGSIIEEHEIANPIKHVNQSKVCGVWRKVPKTYRKLLPKEKLSMELASERYPDGIVAGKVLRNMRINKEVFSSLLIPGSPKSKETLGGGGIAIIYTEGNSIYLYLEFNGIFLLTDSRDVPVYVQLLETSGEAKLRTVSSSVVIISKVYPEYNAVSAKIDLSQEAQRLLYSGHLSLRLSARDDAMFLLGKITLKVTCNIFQATMTLEGDSASSAVASLGDGSFSPPMTSNPWSNSRSPVGTAVVALKPDGSLVYSIETVDLPDQPVLVTLDSEDPTKNQLYTLLTGNETFLTDNKVTGLFPKSSKNVQEVEMLLGGDLFITMSTPRGPSWPRLSGRVRQRLYSDAFVNEAPLTLVPEVNETPSAVGQAWLSVDKECGLHYAVYLAGLTIAESPPNHHGKHDHEEKNKEKHLLELREEPDRQFGPPQQRVLQRLNSEDAEDVQDDVEYVTLARMKSGYVSLAISLRSAKGKTVELKAKVVDVPIPVTCLPHHSPSLNGDKDGKQSGTASDQSNNILVDEESPHNCLVEGHTFVDGAQWVSTRDNCIMCSCRRGEVVCDNMVCPSPPCGNPITREGECCKSCPGESPIHANGNHSMGGGPGSSGKSLGCYFEGDKKFHLAGSRWHPYIPPFGFSRCALCTCDAESLVVECARITCPALSGCAEKDAVRDHPLACCKQCPNTISLKSSVILLPGQLGDQGGMIAVNDVQANGGCIFRGKLYANGDIWHPTVQPYGEEKCVSCHCKDKRYRCKRLKCPKLNCQVEVESSGECCPKCSKLSETRNSGSVDRRTTRRRKTRERRIEKNDED